MIRQIFLLVTSTTLLLWGGQKCPDHYNPKWFEEPSDEIVLLLEEYFDDKNITFLPSLAQIKKLKLSPIGHEVWQLPQSTQSYKDLHFPITPGIWRYEQAAQRINTTHLLIKEHTRFSEIEAINVYNGLMGAYWDDYIVDGYEMTLKPEDTRIRYKKKYFELNIKLYGLKNDATSLKYTYSDLIFRDYTHKVEQFIQCQEQK